MKKIFLYLVAFLFTRLAFAQTSGEGNEPMETDRPSQTNAATVVPHGTIQVEAGFSYFKNKTNFVKEKFYQYPTATVRIGVLSKAELRLNSNLQHTSYSYLHSPGEVKGKTGLANVAVGTKVQILKSEGNRPNIAIQVETVLPVGSEQFKPDVLEPKLKLALEEILTDKLSLQANLGVLWEENDDETESRQFDHFGLYTLALNYKVSDKLKIFGEAYGGKREEEDFEQGIDAGLSFLVLPNLQFDAFSGLGISENAPDFFVETGISFRLPK